MGKCVECQYGGKNHQDPRCDRPGYPSHGSRAMNQSFAWCAHWEARSPTRCHDCRYIKHHSLGKNECLHPDWVPHPILPKNWPGCGLFKPRPTPIPTAGQRHHAIWHLKEEPDWAAKRLESIVGATEDLLACMDAGEDIRKWPATVDCVRKALAYAKEAPHHV